MLKKSLYGAFSVLVVLLTVGIALFFFDPINRRIYNDSSGSISEGSFLGASIGHSSEIAVRRLTSMGLELDYIKKGGRCFYEDYSSDNDIFVLRDDSWRKGTVCLVVDRAGSVKTIEWWFGFWWAP